MNGGLILEKILFMSKKHKIRDIKPGLIIINNAISSNYQYIERIDEVDSYSLTITACCRTRITIDNTVDWYSMGTFHQPLDELIYNCRQARINEVWYFNLNLIEEGRFLYE